MPTKVTAKLDTAELEAGSTYEVLKASAWGFLILLGRKRTAWFPKEDFLAA